MKSKKLLLILPLTALLGVGWILSIQTSTGEKVIKEQRELEAKADAFTERQLYMRAIALYEEALEQQSKLNPELEAKLLKAYEGYGDLSSYAKLVLERVAEGTASEGEILKAAEYYADNSKIEAAVSILKDGMEIAQSPELQDYYEEIRYRYKYRITHYSEVIPTTDNSMMPAFNGDKWGYIDENGSERLSCTYESATPFDTSGYAVVSENGTYYTILQTGDRYGADDGTSYEKMTEVQMVSNGLILGKRGETYSYFDIDFAPAAEAYQFEQITGNACGVAAVKKDGKWGIIKDSGKAVTDYIFDDVAINSLGCAYAGDRAMVEENGKWHLIDTEGNKIGEEEYANAKAPESSEYIAVADRSERWGYIDGEGNQVIDYQYHDAISFSNHLGAVKIVNDWGYISEKNELVIQEPYESAKPFHNGIAQAKTAEGMALIELLYAEE